MSILLRYGLLLESEEASTDISISVYDAVTTAESTICSVSDPEVSIIDTISVSESVSGSIDLAVTVYDIVTVADVDTGRVRPPWYLADSITVATGTTSSVVADTWDDDASSYTVTEVTGNPGFNVVLTFEDVPSSLTTLAIHILGWYDGNPAHNVKLYYKYNALDFTEVTASASDLPDATGEAEYYFSFALPESISGGHFELQILHTSNGSAGHYLYIDNLYIGQAGVLSSSIVDQVTLAESIGVVVSDPVASVFDTVELVEVVAVAISDIAVSVYDSIEITESALSGLSDLGAEAVETVSVQEDVIVALGDLVLSVVESSSLSESTISTVSDPLIEVVDDVAVGEEASVSTDEAVLDEEINVQDSVALAESTGTEVSDLLGSVLDTVTLDEQVAAVILLQVEAVDDITVTTAIDLAPPVLEPNIYDSIGVDENIVVGSVLDAVVEDVIGIAEDVTVYQEAVATRVINVSDDVLISELAAGQVSALSLSVFDAVIVSTGIDLFWVVAAGILILDVDIIVPLIDYEMLVPSVDTYIQLPTIDLEVG